MVFKIIGISFQKPRVVGTDFLKKSICLWQCNSKTKLAQDDRNFMMSVPVTIIREQAVFDSKPWSKTLRFIAWTYMLFFLEAILSQAVFLPQDRLAVGPNTSSRSCGLRCLQVHKETPQE